MGACYSKVGHDSSFLHRHKAPKDKNKNISNGNYGLSPDKLEQLMNGSPNLELPISCSESENLRTRNKDSDSDACSLCRLSRKEADAESQSSSQHGEENVVTSDSGIGSFLPPEETLELIDSEILPIDDSDCKAQCKTPDDSVWKLRSDIQNEKKTLCSPNGVDRAKWLYKMESERGEDCVVEESEEDIEDEASTAEINRSGTSVELENCVKDSNHQTLEPSDISLQDLRHYDSEASLDLELPSILPKLSEMRTMKIDGQDVVVMDVESFTQIVEEVSMLKQKLSQLTAVILEEGSISCRSSLSGIASH